MPSPCCAVVLPQSPGSCSACVSVPESIRTWHLKPLSLSCTPPLTRPPMVRL